MQRLFQFLYAYRAFFIFLLLEVLCGYLVIKNNQYQNAAFLNSSNAMVGQVMTVSDNVSTYFHLRQVNQELAMENVRLRNELTQQSPGKRVVVDTLQVVDSVALENDSAAYAYQVAKVINNSVDRFNNFLTINRGEADGVHPGMGVVTSRGIVGKVKAASDHFATVYSVLHTNFYISALIEDTKTFCTAKWDGTDPLQIDLLYVPRHVKLKKGQEIVTSGYNAVFPAGIPIGKIASFELRPDATFYDIKVDLSVDFQRVAYVYVINNAQRQEIDSLQQQSISVEQ